MPFSKKLGTCTTHCVAFIWKFYSISERLIDVINLPGIQRVISQSILFLLQKLATFHNGSSAKSTFPKMGLIPLISLSLLWNIRWQSFTFSCEQTFSAIHVYILLNLWHQFSCHKIQETQNLFPMFGTRIHRRKNVSNYLPFSHRNGKLYVSLSWARGSRDDVLASVDI